MLLQVHNLARVKVFYLFTICLFLMISESFGATLIFNNDFEGDTLSGLRYSGNCPSKTSDTISGKYAASFKLNSKDEDHVSHRSSF